MRQDTARCARSAVEEKTMEQSAALTELLSQQQVVLEDQYWVRIVLVGLEEVGFFSPRNEKLVYWVEPVGKRGRVLIKIQLQEMNRTIVRHKGDLESVGTRKRIVREAAKQWQ